MGLKLSFVPVALCAVILLALPKAARADTEVFTFSGACQDCAGTGNGTLTLTGYTPGTALSSSNFVSFDYSSNLTSFDVTSSNLNDFGGSIGATPGPYDVVINYGDGGLFISQSGGDWCVGESCLADFGFNNTWSQATGTSPVPEPGTASLVGLGLAAADVVRRRYKR
jgi:PEP-CTERM motif